MTDWEPREAHKGRPTWNPRSSRQGLSFGEESGQRWGTWGWGAGLGAFTNALRLEGYWNAASRRPRQRSPPRYPPLSLRSAQSNPEREAPGISPRGAPLFQPPGKAEETARFRCGSRGAAEESGAYSPLAAAESPLPHSPSAPPPLPRTRRVPEPSETIRRASAGAAAAPGGPTEPSAEIGGARPQPGWPQPGPPSPRALTSARDADSRRTSGRRATARAAGAGADAKGRGLCWGAGSHWPPESPRLSCVLGSQAAPSRPLRRLGHSFQIGAFAVSLVSSRCDGPPRPFPCPSQTLCRLRIFATLPGAQTLRRGLCSLPLPPTPFPPYPAPPPPSASLRHLIHPDLSPSCCSSSWTLSLHFPALECGQVLANLSPPIRPSVCLPPSASPRLSASTCVSSSVPSSFPFPQARSHEALWFASSL